MRGNRWVGVSSGDDTEREVVLRLFDRAVGAGGHGYTIVVLHYRSCPVRVNTETAIPVSSAPPSPAREELPQRLRELRRLYTRTGSRAESFTGRPSSCAITRTAYPGTAALSAISRPIKDMTTRQLRGYFTWRAAVRRGEVSADLHLGRPFTSTSCSTASAGLAEVSGKAPGVGGRDRLDSGIGEPGCVPTYAAGSWNTPYCTICP